MRNFSHNRCTENNFQYISSQNHAVYDIMLQNVVEPGIPQMTTWRKRISCWILKATNTHTQTLYCPTNAHNVKKRIVIKTF